MQLEKRSAAVLVGAADGKRNHCGRIAPGSG